MRFKFKVKGLSSYFYIAKMTVFGVLKMALASKKHHVNNTFWEVLT